MRVLTPVDFCNGSNRSPATLSLFSSNPTRRCPSALVDRHAEEPPAVELDADGEDDGANAAHRVGEAAVLGGLGLDFCVRMRRLNSGGRKFVVPRRVRAEF